MGAFFGIASKKDCLLDVFFGTDYHTHLGTYSGGLACYDEELGLQRKIHNLGNAPFRTKFESLLTQMKGNSAIGCISDTAAQPLMIRSHLGTYVICSVGKINNSEQLTNEYLENNCGHFGVSTEKSVNPTELVACLINQKNSFLEGIRYAQEQIEGTANILILTDNGKLIAARDNLGRLPVLIGKNKFGHCVAFESFSYLKLGYKHLRELGPAEIVEITAEEVKTLQQPKDKMRICSFLWTYYGFPTSCYEGKSVEVVRCKNGELLAKQDEEHKNNIGIDYACGVPDSGTPHAIGYANKSKIPFARPYIKYTPSWSRSFTPPNQADRSKVAKMKQIPIHELIENKNLLFVDDSIVRGTQLKETVEFLYENGAKSVHMRSACPPIMFACKYLNFSRVTSDMELITRRVIVELEGEEGLNYIDEYRDAKTERGKKMRKAICEKFGFDSLEFQSLENTVEAIGLEPCKLCTYCWDGKE